MDDEKLVLSEITRIGETKIEKKLKEIEIIIEKILEIKKDYFNNNVELRELGSIIKNESKEDEDIGIEFFKILCKSKLKNYNEKIFYKIWYSINIEEIKLLTINTLKKKLKNILPVKNDINENNNILEMVNDYSIAEEWTKRFGEKYICIDVEKKYFLEWNGIWEETKSGSNIRLSLSNELKNKFKEGRLNVLKRLNILQNEKKEKEDKEVKK